MWICRRDDSGIVLLDYFLFLNLVYAFLRYALQMGWKRNLCCEFFLLNSGKWSNLNGNRSNFFEKKNRNFKIRLYQRARNRKI